MSNTIPKASQQVPSDLIIPRTFWHLFYTEVCRVPGEAVVDPLFTVVDPFSPTHHGEMRFTG